MEEPWAKYVSACSGKVRLSEAYALAQLPALSARAQSAEISRDFYRRTAVIVDHLESF